MGYNNYSDFSWGFYKNRGWTKPNLVTYMESHDEERMMFRNLQYGNSSNDYNTKDFNTAIDRQKLVAAFFFTLPGPKMIWQFGELGYDYSINYNGRTGEKPIRWDYLNEPKRKELYDLYSKLIKIRLRNEVFTSPLTSVDFDLDNTNGLKRIRLSHPSMSAVVIGNFGLTAQAIDPGFFYTATWYDDINGEELVVDDQNAVIELGPGEFKIYTNRHLLDIESDEDSSTKIYSFSLSQNFPNPFNPVTRINYSIPFENSVQIIIYNINGQKVEMLVDEIKPAGIHYIDWEASELTSGIYFYKLTAGEFTDTKKMILIK
jgi:hypothetical protein